jgi:hypothetical protein
MPGLPIQANSLVIPADGLAVIITTDTDPRVEERPTASPPLSLDEFAHGSAPARSVTLELIWFDGNGRTYLATVKTGAEVSFADRQAIDDVIRSIRVDAIGM